MNRHFELIGEPERDFEKIYEVIKLVHNLSAFSDWLDAQERGNINWQPIRLELLKRVSDAARLYAEMMICMSEDLKFE